MTTVSLSAACRWKVSEMLSEFSIYVFEEGAEYFQISKVEGLRYAKNPKKTQKKEKNTSEVSEAPAPP